MSAAREAFVLPLVLLTVALAGGFRLPSGGGMRFLVPPLAALVLGTLLMGVAARAGLLRPGLLMNERRTGLENVSGAVVLASLFAASAQVVSSLAPEKGLMHVLYYFFFAVLLWNTLAAHPDRMRLLHSLFVILGSAFVFKYMLLAGLFDPQGGLTRRVLTTLLEGVALGTLEHEAFAPATGYVAFFTSLLYLIGLVLLPRTVPGTTLVRVEPTTDDVLEPR